MGRPITIEIVSKVSKFLRGADQVEDSLEDITDELKDVADEGEDLERELSNAFDDAARSADKFADKTERSMRDVGDAGEKAGRDTGDGFKEELGAEVGEEAAENISEAFRNGDFVGAGIETATSLTSGFMSSLGLAGAAIGIGAGIIGGIAAGMLENQERIKGIGISLGESLGAAIAEGTSRQDFRGIAVEAIEEMFEGEALTELYAQLELAGSSMNELVAAVMGGPEALALLQEDLRATAAAGSSLEESGGRQHVVLTDAAKAALAAAGGIGDLGKASEVAAAYAIAHADALSGEIDGSDQARVSLDGLADSKGKSGEASKEAEGASKGSKKATDAEARSNRKAADAADTKAKATQRLKEKVSDLEAEIAALPNEKTVTINLQVNRGALDELKRLVERLP